MLIQKKHPMRKRLILGLVIGSVILILLLISLSFSRAFFIYNIPVKSQTMIIEAWVPSFEIEQAVKMIKSDSISRVIIIGKNYTDDSESVLSMFHNDVDSIETRRMADSSSRTFGLAAYEGVKVGPEPSFYVLSKKNSQAPVAFMREAWLLR